jgi:hypothetical protein
MNAHVWKAHSACESPTLPLMHVGDMLTDEDTFMIVASSMEEVTKIKALHTPKIMQAISETKNASNGSSPSTKKKKG